MKKLLLLLVLTPGCATLTAGPIERAMNRDIHHANRVCRQHNSALRWVTRSVDDVLRIECVNGDVLEISQEVRA